MFIGRYEEIKEIREALDSSDFEAIILYGRRRVERTFGLEKEESNTGLDDILAFKKEAKEMASIL